MINTLPRELIITICQYLTTTEISRLRKVAKKFASICKDILLSKKKQYNKLIHPIIQKKNLYLKLKGKDREFSIKYGISNYLKGGWNIEEYSVEAQKIYALGKFVPMAVISRDADKNMLKRILLYLLCNDYIYPESLKDKEEEDESEEEDK